MTRLSSVIERRLLVNYRADPEVVAKLLPAPLRPQLVGDRAVAGICAIRLGAVRPTGLPAAIGTHSENAAHRIAVEWDGPDGVETGVYIPRRDTGSVLNVLVGGRIFPGAHHRADFTVRAAPGALHIAFTSRDGSAWMRADVHEVDHFSGSPLFPDLAAATDFFRGGSVGYSSGLDPHLLDGIELSVARWQLHPLEIDEVRSSFFEDPRHFPPGSIAFDSAMLMRDVAAEWFPRDPMRVADYAGR
ncbi:MULTISPECIES: DUF2071 domain-containing protein [unclassified Nocardia]|uniref:DUF2071 domain-containing protein n=1 Tax=unclassified Nocardia TaxID=2637762 RepID=UPI001CE411D9|nr:MULTISPECIES: DUF2071 domain-containing protein [unclassified Nocardia]